MNPALQIAKEIAAYFQIMGAQARVATNDALVLPLHLAVDIAIIGYTRGNNPILETCGNIGLRLMRHVAYELWVHHAVATTLNVRATQRLYNMVRSGIVPLGIKIPAKYDVLLEFQDLLAPTIAHAALEAMPGGDIQ